MPKAYYPAIVLAMVPNIAPWATGQVNNALAAAGTSAAEVGFANLSNAGTIYEGLMLLGAGAVLAGMVLGAIAVFMIDRNFLWAAGLQPRRRRPGGDRTDPRGGGRVVANGR